MLNMVSNYSLDEHTIIPTDLAQWCNRMVEGDPLREGKFFTIRYNKLGVFVLAEWLDEPRRGFVDVMNLGNSIGISQEKAGELRRRILAPLTAEETVLQTVQADSDYHHGLQDENEEETERWSRVARGE